MEGGTKKEREREKARKPSRAFLVCRMAEHSDSLFLFVATPLANKTVWNSSENEWEHDATPHPPSPPGTLTHTLTLSLRWRFGALMKYAIWEQKTLACWMLV